MKIGKKGTAWLREKELTDLAMERIKELKRIKRKRHHQDIELDGRIILFLAKEVERLAEVVLEYKEAINFMETQIEKMATAAEENEYRSIVAENAQQEISQREM